MPSIVAAHDELHTREQLLGHKDHAVLLPSTTFNWNITPFLQLLDNGALNSQVDINAILSNDDLYSLHASNAKKLILKSDKPQSIWLTFTLNNQMNIDHEMNLMIETNKLANIELYQVNGKEHTLLNNNLTHITQNTGSLKNTFDYRIHASPYTKEQYYLHIETPKDFFISAELKTANHFLYEQQRQSTILGILLGLLLASVIFFYYSWIKMKIAFSLSSIVYSIILAGLVPFWFNLWIFPPSLNFLANTAILLLVFANIFIKNITIYLLGWQADDKAAVKKSLIYLSGILSALLLYSFVTFTGNQKLDSSLAIIAALNSLLILFILYKFKSPHEKAQKILFYGYSFVTTGMFINCLFIFGIIPDYYSFNFIMLLLPAITIFILVKANIELVYTELKANANFQFKDDTSLPKALSKLSHQLRSPINGVLGMSELLTETQLTHLQQDHLQTINLAGRDLLHLANEMSDFSKLQMDGIELESRAFDLPYAIHQCMASFREEANRKKIELLTDIPDEITAPILGDKERLQTILINLIGHSLDHIENGEISLKIIKGTSENKRGFIFQLQLTGSLLDIQSIRRFFSTITDKKKRDQLDIDAGLSLIITKQLIELMSGNLQLEAMTQQGCSISLFLPLAEDTTKIEVVDSSNLKGLKGLIIDDNANFRTVIKKYFTRWEIKVDTTYSGREALALIRSNQSINEHYDFIVVDHDMPGMNGIEFTQRLMADEEIHPKPIRIMLTGLGVGEAKHAATDAGIQKIIGKPVSGHRLKETLSRLVNKKD